MLLRIVFQGGMSATATSTSAKLFKRTFRRSLKFKVYFSDKKFARAARLVVFLAFVPIADVEDVFYEITYYIQSNYPQLMVVVNYFENTYLGSVIVDKEERVPPKFPLGFWNHYSRILKDPEFPRTSNMLEGFLLPKEGRLLMKSCSRSAPNTQITPASLTICLLLLSILDMKLSKL